MATHLSTSILVTPHATISEGTVSWDETGKTVFCGPTAEADLQNGEQIALEGKIAAPGMVNIHTHGGNGIA